MAQFSEQARDIGRVLHQEALSAIWRALKSQEAVTRTTLEAVGVKRPVLDAAVVAGDHQTFTGQAELDDVAEGRAAIKIRGGHCGLHIAGYKPKAPPMSLSTSSTWPRASPVAVEAETS